MTLLAAFLRRDAAIQVSYRADFVLQLLTILFTLTLFFYLGELIDDQSLPEDAGFDQGYFPFVVVGLALLRVAQSSLVSFATKLRQEQTTGTLEALIATPARTTVLVLFSAAYDLLRAAALSFVFVAAAVLFFGLRFDADPAGWALAAAAFILSVALLASVGVLVAGFTIVYKQTTAIVALVTTSIGLLGGVYFPLDLLPPPLEAIGRLLPFTWALDVMRSGLLDGQLEVGRLVLLAVCAAAALPLAGLVLNAAVDRARRDGSLAQY